MTPYWKARLGILLVFVLGALAGALAASVFYAHRTTAFFQRGSAAYVDIIERRLTRRLHLDSDQRAKVHEYLMENLAHRKELQARIHPEIRGVNVETVQEIKQILRPEQADLFRQNLLNVRTRLGADTDVPAEENTNAAPAGG